MLRPGGRGSEALATAEALKKLPNPLGDDARIDIVEGRAAESLGDFRRDLTATTRAVNKGRAGRRIPSGRASIRR
jgi:hypothetical protein